LAEGKVIGIAPPKTGLIGCFTYLFGKTRVSQKYYSLSDNIIKVFLKLKLYLTFMWMGI
jgi:hypothetical protein